jgi:hypothetical protein
MEVKVQGSGADHTLTDQAPTPDVVRIGDGTDALDVNADGSLSVKAPGGGALATAAKQDAEAILVGAVTETAPASDTASSGLNGRLQRIAQRLTSLIALLPAALGSTAAASSLAVTASTEDIARTGIITETAPASDTASSGLNGRLQRIAQRLTTLLAVFPTTIDTNSGVKSASTLRMVLATDQPNLTTPMNVNNAQFNGVTALMGNGVTGTGSLRVTVASDNTPFPIKIDQTTPGTTNASSLSHIGATAVASGNGVVSAGVQRVAIASDNTAFTVNAKTAGCAKANAPAYNDHTSVSITTSAYTQLVASTTTATTSVEIFDSSGECLILAVGAAASEVDQIYIFPGGNSIVPLLIPASSRVSVKAKTAATAAGYLAINFYA